MISHHCIRLRWRGNFSTMCAVVFFSYPQTYFCDGSKFPFAKFSLFWSLFNLVSTVARSLWSSMSKHTLDSVRRENRSKTPEGFGDSQETPPVIDGFVKNSSWPLSTVLCPRDEFTARDTNENGCTNRNRFPSPSVSL